MKNQNKTYKPLLSIIIPVYNIEDYIEDCTSSILEQDFDNYEVILVDDGSTDSSGALCDKIAASNNHVNVIRKQNEGLVSARIAGSKCAKGEYIVHVDGDDLVDHLFMLKIKEIVDCYKYPDVICFGLKEYPTKNPVTVYYKFQEGYYDTESIRQDLFPYLVHSKTLKNFPLTLCSKAIKKDLYLKFGNIDHRIAIGEDLAATIPIIAHSSSLYISNEELYFYRNNPESMTKDLKPYDINFPNYIHKELINSLKTVDYSFKEQLYRLDTRNIFNSFYSQFYSGEKYRHVKNILKDYRSKDWYVEAINNSKFSFSLVLLFMKYSLKFKLYFLVLIYSKIYARFKH